MLGIKCWIYEYRIFKLQDDEMNAEKIITKGKEELLTKNEQLVLQDCRAKGMTMSRVLPPWHKTCLATNQVANRFERGW